MAGAGGAAGAAGAERMRQALLVVAQTAGTSAADVRAAREELDAARATATVAVQWAIAHDLDHATRHRLETLVEKDWEDTSAPGSGAKGEARAETVRQSVLLLTETEGVNAAYLRSLRMSRDAARIGASVAANYAAKYGDSENMQMLLGAGIDKDKKGPFSLTPAHCAAEEGNVGCLRVLLEAGADKDKQDDYGETPAHHATECGNVDCLRLLIEAGADIHKSATTSALLCT